MWTLSPDVHLTDEWMNEVDLLSLICSVNIDMVLVVNNVISLE